MKKDWYRLLTIISAITFLSWAGAGIYYGSTKKVFVSPFDYTVNIYQRNVVNANSIPQAIINIDIALEYIEKNASLQHEIDVDLRREALKKYRAELAQLRPELSISRRFNDLLLLRGSLIDRKNFGSRMAVLPEGVSATSAKKSFMALGIVSGILTAVFSALWFQTSRKTVPRPFKLRPAKI